MTETRKSRIQSFAFVLSVWFCVVFSAGIVSLGFVRYRSAIGGNEITLEDKINPNNAPAASLARLPNIGRLRAQAIVAYRENFKEKSREGQPFQNSNDLQKVKGIGPKTAQNISKWLMFE